MREHHPDFLKTVIDVARDHNMQPIAVCDIKKYLASGDDRPLSLSPWMMGIKIIAIMQHLCSKPIMCHTIFVSKG